MERLIVSNHKVLADFIRMIKGTNNIPQKSSVSAEDVQGKKVFSDHRLPPGHLEQVGFMFIVMIDDRVNLSRCSLSDLVCAVPRIEPIIPKSQENNPKYIQEAQSMRYTRDEIRKIYLKRTDSLEIMGESLVQEAEKARERLGLLKSKSN